MAQHGVPSGLESFSAHADEQFRRTGIDPVSTVPWGAHLCVFYKTRKDLIDVHAPYLKAGIEGGEFCLWALSDPVTREDAVAGISAAYPEFRRHLAEGHVELVDGYEWYSPGSRFSADRVVDAWHAKLTNALAQGFAGLRFSGNAFWCETDSWESFRDYEAKLDASLVGRKIVGLCTYRLGETRANDMLNVASVHGVSIARRHGQWELLETIRYAEADVGIDCPNERNGKSRNGAARISMLPPFAGHEDFTPRERAVLAQLIKGASSKDAARELGVSPRTIEFHRANLMRKVGARNVGDLLGKVLLRGR
jgi:DNA-binding CsgD family transcriptional regulator